MGVDDLDDRLIRELQHLRRSDGGFPTSMDGQSEVEPTAVAALALEDGAAREWLAARQRPDGGFGDPDGRPEGPATAALAALALEGNTARRALSYAVSLRGLQPPGAADPGTRVGWGWTSDVRSTVEPTSRVLLATKALTPGERAVRREALALLGERQCADGGWNYGNASVNDVDLRGYAQTTAIALIALQGEARALAEPGLHFLRRSWRNEPGGLTTAQALVAFRLHGDGREARAAREALGVLSRRPSFAERPLTVAWAVLAAGPDSLLRPLRARG